MGYEEFPKGDMNNIYEESVIIFGMQSKAKNYLNLATGPGLNNPTIVQRLNLAFDKNNFLITDENIAQLKRGIFPSSNLSPIVTDISRLSIDDSSIDLVSGVLPYSSMNKDYRTAIREAVRTLKKGGYHIILEMQAERIFAPRKNNALINALEDYADDTRSELDSLMTHIGSYHQTAEFDPTYEPEDDMAFQRGDIIKTSVHIHRL